MPQLPGETFHCEFNTRRGCGLGRRIHSHWIRRCNIGPPRQPEVCCVPTLFATLNFAAILTYLVMLLISPRLTETGRVVYSKALLANPYVGVISKASAKFPSRANILFLLTEFHSSSRTEPMSASTVACKRMRARHAREVDEGFSELVVRFTSLAAQVRL